MPANRTGAQLAATWRSAMLAGSETFIRNQIDIKHAWATVAIGAQQLISPVSRSSDVILYDDGVHDKIARKLFFRTRRSTRLLRALEASSADLVHAHFLPEAYRVLPTVRALDLPLVVTAHGYDVCRTSLVQSREYRRAVKQVFDYAGCVVAVSNFVASKLEELGCPPSKVRVVPIGIPVPNTPSPQPGHCYDFVYVGRLVEYKGAKDLLRGVALMANPSKHRVAIAGSGPLLPTLQSIASSLNLDVTFLGHLAPEEVRSLLLRSKIFVGPSRSDEDGAQEAFGLVFLEAGLAGIPVVSYGGGGIPEAVLHGETGLLADERDILGLSRYLEYLLCEPSARTEMGAAARARVIKHFDCRERKFDLEQIYSEVVW